MDWGAIIPSLSDGERPVALLAAADELDCPWSDWLRSAAHRLRPALLFFPQVKVKAWQGTQWVEEYWFNQWKYSVLAGTALRVDLGEDRIFEGMQMAWVPGDLAVALKPYNGPYGLRYRTEREAWAALFRGMGGKE